MLSLANIYTLYFRLNISTIYLLKYIILNYLDLLLIYIYIMYRNSEYEAIKDGGATNRILVLRLF